MSLILQPLYHASSARASWEDKADRPSDAVNFTFIDARLVRIMGQTLLQTAIYQSVLAQLEAQDSRRTKTVHSEILWALSPTNNARRLILLLQYCLNSSLPLLMSLSEAIRRYGVSDNITFTSLFVVRISSPDPDNVQQLMSSLIFGILSPLNNLVEITDWGTVKKVGSL
ncbi:hypothetical protein V8D89_005664, partial [Ganoderma adspersum]